MSCEMEKYLFVGGCKDGQKLEVPKDEDKVIVPVPVQDKDISLAESHSGSMPTMRQQTYYKATVCGNDIFIRKGTSIWKAYAAAMSEEFDWFTYDAEHNDPISQAMLAYLRQQHELSEMATQLPNTILMLTGEKK